LRSETEAHEALKQVLRHLHHPRAVRRVRVLENPVDMRVMAAAVVGEMQAAPDTPSRLTLFAGGWSRRGVEE
jgi:hypothetical protein